MESVDKYYDTHVKSIFSNIVKLLDEDALRKIVWSETFYLKMCMENQPPSVRDRFRELVTQNRIEIVGGGIVLNDEANPDLEMLVRQLDLGHQYLHENFAIERIKVGWQIDSYGHSAITPSLWSRFGYEYLVINKVNINFKNELKESGNLEFIWRGADLGDDDEIFTHLIYEDHTITDLSDSIHFKNCFIFGQIGDEIVSTCLKKLFDLVKQRAGGYKTDKIMMIVGDDYYFSKQEEGRNLFQKIERLRNYANEKFIDIKIKIATPTEYFEAVKEQKAKYSTYDGDFFPYQTFMGDEPLFWTGYFSTRPALKQLISETHSLVRAAELAKSMIHSETFDSNDSSLALHHNIMTGACKSIVAEEYKSLLLSEQNRANTAIHDVIKSVIKNIDISYDIAVPYKVMILFNPLNWDKVSLVVFESENYLEIKT